MSSAPATGSNRPPVASYTSPGCTCPRCKGPAVRIPRLLSDLLLSMFVTVGRIRCIAEDCGWEGKMRVKRHPLLVQGPW